MCYPPAPDRAVSRLPDRAECQLRVPRVPSLVLFSSFSSGLHLSGPSYLVLLLRCVAVGQTSACRGYSPSELGATQVVFFLTMGYTSLFSTQAGLQYLFIGRIMF